MEGTHASGEVQGQPLRFWSKDWRRQVLGLLLGPGLVYAYAIAVSAGYLSERWMYLGTHWHLLHYLMWLAFRAGLTCLWLWLVLRFVCGDRLFSLSRRPGDLLTDVLHGTALALILIMVNRWVYDMLLACFQTGSTGAVHEITKMDASSPLFVFLAMGPDTWLAAAVGEEFRRIMLLSCLWKLGSSRLYLCASVGLAAVLFGLCHYYQGTTGFICAIALGVIFSLYYLIYGRPLAMIFAHGLVDTYVKSFNITGYLSIHGFKH